MYKTSRGHGFRGSQYWSGAVSITVRASWYGLKMSFLAQTPYGQPPTRVTVRDKTSFDEAGYEFQEPLVEQVKVPKWVVSGECCSLPFSPGNARLSGQMYKKFSKRF